MEDFEREYNTYAQWEALEETKKFNDRNIKNRN